MMNEIKIRGIDARTVTAIDEMAQSKGKSRNQFLKEQLELLALHPELRRKDDAYSEMLTMVTGALEDNTKILEQIVEILKP